MERVKDKYIYLLIFIIYVILVFLVGYNHEPWADEAQCWLIARDNSFFSVFQITKYEGHPIVWFLIEKGFIEFFSKFINITHLYNFVFLLPLFMSSIGVFLLLFKSKFPIWFKVLCPFTFYVFYQYGVIARNHCLCFPMLAILATFFPNRFKHPYIYIILLIINANVSAYLYPISLTLIGFFIFDLYKSKNEIETKIYKLPIIICIFFLCCTGFHMYNPPDCYFWNGISWDLYHLCKKLKEISSIYFPSNDSIFLIIFNLMITVFLYFLTMKIYCKNIYQKVLFLLLNIPTFPLFIYLYSQHWHHGYAFIILLFSCWILADINNIDNIPFKKNICFYFLIFFVLGYYVLGNLRVSYFDLINNYSGSKDAVNFIKKYNLQNYKINGLGMKSVALQPYFKDNIYNNYIDATHFSWKQTFFDKYNDKKFEYTPVIVLANWDFWASNPEYENYIRKISNKYNKYNFPGEMRGLNYKNGNVEKNSYIIYIDKELAKKHNISSE